MSAPEQRKPPLRAALSRTMLSLIGAFALVTLAGIVLGLVLTGYYTRRERAEVGNRLIQMADRGERALEEWWLDRRQEAAIIAETYALFKPDGEDLLDRPRPLLGGSQWEKPLGTTRSHTALAVIDLTTTTPFAADSALELHPATREAVARVKGTGALEHSVLFTLPADSSLYVDILAPIGPRNTRDSLALALLMRVNVTADMLSLFHYHAKSDEYVVIWRQGDTISAINALRHPTFHRFPVTLGEETRLLPAARVAEGNEGIFRGLDYRGVPVVAALRQTHVLGLGLVAKIDEAEAYEELDQVRRQILLFSLLAILAPVLVGTVIWLNRRAALLRQRAEWEARYRIIFGGINDALLVVDDVGRIVDTNSRAQDLYGYTSDEFVVLSLADLFPPEERRSLRLIRDGVLPAGDGHLEAYQRRADGSVFPAEVSARYLKVGTEDQLVLVVRDRTSEVQSRDELSLTAERYRQVTEAAGDCLWEVDHEGCITYVGARIEEILGYSPDEIVGRQMWEYFTSQQRERLRAMLDRTTNARQPLSGVTTEVLHADGATRIIEASAVPLHAPDGTVCGYRGVLRDITPQETARRQLHEALVNFQRLADNFPGFVFIVDHEGHYRAANLRVAELLGTNLSDLIGTQRFIRPDHPDLFRELANARHVSRRDITMSVNGEVRHFDELLVPVPTGNHDEVLIHCTALDVTERVQAEESLRGKLRAEEIISAASSAFIRGADSDEAINAALAEMGRFSGADRSYVFMSNDNTQTMSNTHEWCAEGVSREKDNLQNLPLSLLPWWVGKLRDGEIIRIDDVSAMPPEADLERRILENQDIRSLVVFPFFEDQELAGFVGFDSVRAANAWSQDEAATLQIFSELIGNAIVRTRVERALHQSEEQFRSAFESATIGIALVRPDGRFMQVNDSLCEMVGYTARELEATDSQSITHSEDIQPGLRLAERALAGEIPSYTVEKRHIHKRGHVVWTRLSASLVRDARGNPVHFVFQIEDITEVKRAHEELLSLNRALAEMNVERMEQLERERDRMNAILLSVTDGLIVTDLSRQIVLANPAAQRIFGIRSAQDSALTLEAAIGGEAANEVLPPTAGALHEIPDAELQVMTPEGQELSFSARTAEVHARNGELVGYVTLFRDTTRLRELDAMKTDFVSTAAHELRTPLTTLRGFSEILLTRAVSEDERQRFLGYINAQSIVLTDIVSDLLDISRLEAAGVGVLNLARCDVQAICRAEAASAQRLTRLHGIDVSGLQPIPEIIGDEKRVAQVVRNLLSNALKYSPDGGEIQMACEATERWALITVRDHGIGMAPDQVGRVFDKFYRADMSTTAAQGIGLGLSIVRQLVRHHGGAVWLESELGVGTTARVALPLADAATLALIIGETYLSVETLAREFGERGWRTVRVSTPDDGIAAARDELPNVTILALPVTDQYRLVKELRADQRTSNLMLLSLAELEDVLGTQRIGRGRQIDIVRRDTAAEDIVRRALFLDARRRSTVEVSVR